MPKRKLFGRTMKEHCPNCGSIWGPGSEEYEFQECDACGWPSPHSVNFMNEDESADPYDDYDDYCERHNPNDASNL